MDGDLLCIPTMRPLRRIKLRKPRLVDPTLEEYLAETRHAVEMSSQELEVLMEGTEYLSELAHDTDFEPTTVIVRKKPSPNLDGRVFCEATREDATTIPGFAARHPASGAVPVRALAYKPLPATPPPTASLREPEIPIVVVHPRAPFSARLFHAAAVASAWLLATSLGALMVAILVVR
jgi:hypothetical protein